MEPPKPLLESKTFWSNLALTILVAVNQYLGSIEIDNSTLAAVYGILNIILRLLTTRGAKVF